MFPLVVKQGRQILLEGRNYGSVQDRMTLTLIISINKNTELRLVNNWICLVKQKKTEIENTVYLYTLGVLYIFKQERNEIIIKTIVIIKTGRVEPNFG